MARCHRDRAHIARKYLKLSFRRFAKAFAKYAIGTSQGR
jgi:hypothetical protein